MNKKITFTKEEEKTRLDVFLTEELGQTRSQVKRMILSGLVLINNKPAKVHTFLRKDDEILVKGVTSETSETRKQAGQENIKTNEKQSIPEKTFIQKIKSFFTSKSQNQLFTNEPKVMKETKNYLIIEKPSGMLVHPTLKNETDTLVDWLLQKYPNIKGVGENPARPGLVHRLDKEVSGVMIIARNLDAFDSFKKQFKLRTIKKYYTALVHGVIEKDTGLIDFNIDRSKSGKFVAVPKGSKNGKPSQTEFEVLKRFDNHTLVKINLLTGRTNQIRVHFNAIGHPLVGETLYISNKVKNKAKIKLDRVFLHATYLSFKDLKGQTQTFESALSPKLQAILDKIK